MTAASVHLCLVSAQATPNVTPILDPDLRPQEVVLLVSPDMARRADWLEAVLRPTGVRVNRWAIDDAYNVEHIYERVWHLLDGRSDDAIVLNATGGTKPMSLAAVDAFRDWQRPIFYVLPERDRLVWLHPHGREGHDLANRVRLPAFLAAHGAQVQSMRSDGISRRFRTLGERLVQDIERLGDALGTLNWLAHAADKDHRSPPLEPHQSRNRPVADLLDLFAQAGALRREGRRVRFADDEARFFANGGWLEEHVFGVIYGLRSDLPSIQDVGRSLDILRSTPDGTVPNEIDAAFLAENRLYLIECKTRSWKKDAANRPGANALYRLDTLKDLLGGLQARAMLVTYRPLGRADLQRADDLRIRVCMGTQLQHLGEALRRWIR